MVRYGLSPPPPDPRVGMVTPLSRDNVGGGGGGMWGHCDGLGEGRGGQWNLFLSGTIQHVSVDVPIYIDNGKKGGDDFQLLVVVRSYWTYRDDRRNT